MDFKKAILLFSSCIAILISCNDVNSDYVQKTPSSDAQIYNFAISAQIVTHDDSLAFPAMAKTKFVVDNNDLHIYNYDSLPFNTKLRKILITPSFSPNGAGPWALKLIYPKDSIVDLKDIGKDSVDVSEKTLGNSDLKLKVIAQDRRTEHTYDLELRIHKIDPDTMLWHKMPDSPISFEHGKILYAQSQHKLYAFVPSTSSDFKNLTVYVADQQNGIWSTSGSFSINAAPVNLSSISFLNNHFYLTDQNGNAYSSSDAVTWTQINSGIRTILGVLPMDGGFNNTDQDSLLVITQNNGLFSYAKTADLKTLRSVSSEDGSSDFSKVPMTDFSSQVIRRFSSLHDGQRFLSISQGKLQDNQPNSSIWIFQSDSETGILQLGRNSTLPDSLKNAVSVGYYNFDYDLYKGQVDRNYYYILGKNKLFRTYNLQKWEETPHKEILDSKMPLAENQIMVSDDQNYIWIIGGQLKNGAFTKEVWRGRLNKLIPKTIN